MGKENKNTLCKLSKEVSSKKDIKRFKSALINPQYVCKKCLRMASAEKYLCKPVSISIIS